MCNNPEGRLIAFCRSHCVVAAIEVRRAAAGEKEDEDENRNRVSTIAPSNKNRNRVSTIVPSNDVHIALMFITFVKVSS